MKKYLATFLIFVICLTFAGCNQANNGNDNHEADEKIEIAKVADMNCNTVSADRYEMSINLDEKTKILSGIVAIEVTNNTTDTIKELHIRDYAATLTTSEVSDFKINDEGLKYTISKNDQSIIVVSLNEDLQPNETVTLTMSFNSTVPEKKDRFGYTNFDEYTVYNLSFCYPVLSMYAGGEWYDHPYLDSSSEVNISAVSDYVVNVTAPSGYMVVATGNENTEGNTTRITGENCREFAMVISNGLNVMNKTACNTQINYYYFDYEGNRNFNNSLCDAAVKSFELYNNYFGNYIFDELDVVQTFMDSAMEYPGLTMIGMPDRKMDELKVLDNEIEVPYADMSRVAHEVAHQWFYAAVGSDPYLQPWLDEGIAEYCEDVLYHSSIPDADFSELPITEMDNYISQVVKDKHIINQKLTDYKGDNYSFYVYEGGKMFLYELCKNMGEEKFQAAMREYYETYKLKIANTDSFIQIIKKHDSSEEVISIINKYIAQ